MQSNKLRLAIRATAATVVMGVASQASALTLNVGDDTEASLYGYARLNMSYDLDGNRAVSTRAGTFASSANEDVEGHFGADVQQSRLGVKVKHASGVATSVVPATVLAVCVCVTRTVNTTVSWPAVTGPTTPAS